MNKRLVSTAAAVVLFGGASLSAYGCGEYGMKATQASDDESGVKMSTMTGNESGIGGNALVDNDSSSDIGVLLVEEAGTGQ